MKMPTIRSSSWKTWKGASATLVVFAFQDEAPQFLGLDKNPAYRNLQTLAKTDGFRARAQETQLIRPADGVPAERLLLVGLGKRNSFNLEILRQAAASAAKRADALKLKQLAVRAPDMARNPSALTSEVQALAEGIFLSSYRYDRHRQVPEETAQTLEAVTLLSQGAAPVIQKALQRGQIFSQATMLVRDLVNEPPSRMNPEHLSQEALKLKAPISVKVLGQKELEKLNMGGILGVGVGSAVPPRLVELHYSPARKAKKTVALVGKGITFDSGGLSLKPAQHMETMKTDMAGAATVIGVFSALAALKPAVEVYGYLAIAENMPGGRATKPGDILKTHNGKTIEVLNTDAEGRLVLADALAYAGSKKPSVIIDVATLTGACVVALGSSVSGVLGNNPALVRRIVESGEKAGEKFWELPLVEEYKEHIKSKVADVQNIGARRGEAGAIIGGLFLQEFVDGTAWAHLDIAGPARADSDLPYCPAGATGHPVRTLLHYLESL